jgi:hypothetical protein
LVDCKRFILADCCDAWSLLREAISGRAAVLILGQKKVKSHKEISLFCDLNSIYSGINLKLWDIFLQKKSYKKSG